jgi:hypothetical protein
MDVWRSLKASKLSDVEYMNVWCLEFTFEMVGACVPSKEFMSKILTLVL